MVLWVIILLPDLLSPSGGARISPWAASTLLPKASATSENGPLMRSCCPLSVETIGSVPGAGSFQSSARTSRIEAMLPSHVSGKVGAAGNCTWTASFLASLPPNEWTMLSQVLDYRNRFICLYFITRSRYGWGRANRCLAFFLSIGIFWWRLICHLVLFNHIQIDRRKLSVLHWIVEYRRGYLSVSSIKGLVFRLLFGRAPRQTAWRGDGPNIMENTLKGGIDLK